MRFVLRDVCFEGGLSRVKYVSMEVSVRFPRVPDRTCCLLGPILAHSQSASVTLRVGILYIVSPPRLPNVSTLTVCTRYIHN